MSSLGAYLSVLSTHWSSSNRLGKLSRSVTYERGSFTVMWTQQGHAVRSIMEHRCDLRTTEHGVGRDISPCDLCGATPIFFPIWFLEYYACQGVIWYWTRPMNGRQWESRASVATRSTAIGSVETLKIRICSILSDDTRWSCVAN